ncbi:MAG: hypothetical protein IPJ04_00845 [Candidatus Eisenbacteria bacterium]|nr:hypothetical protein [Candidatus Eisenbacteria bacterium]
MRRAELDTAIGRVRVVGQEALAALVLEERVARGDRVVVHAKPERNAELAGAQVVRAERDHAPCVARGRDAAGRRDVRVRHREARRRLERQVDAALHVEEARRIGQVADVLMVGEQHEALVEPEVEREVVADAVAQREVRELTGRLGLDRVAILGEGEAELVAAAATVGIEVARSTLQARAGGVERHRGATGRQQQRRADQREDDGSETKQA